MSATYEVWDSRSGNCLGTFRKVDLARQLVERVLKQDLSALPGLGLLVRDGEALTLLAEGEAILRRTDPARSRAPAKVPA